MGLTNAEGELLYANTRPIIREHICVLWRVFSCDFINLQLAFELGALNSLIGWKYRRTWLRPMCVCVYVCTVGGSGQLCFLSLLCCFFFFKYRKLLFEFDLGKKKQLKKTKHFFVFCNAFENMPREIDFTQQCT